jgi:CHAD domain-containing protein
MAKAWPVEGLSPEAKLDACARAIVETRFREVWHYRAGTIAGEDIEELHSMRVSTRRLRSALRNFGPCFEKASLRNHSTQLRALAASLGAVRDLDVRIQWLERLRDGAPPEVHPGINLLIDRARRAREAARAPMIALIERLEKEDYDAEFLEFVRGGARANG